MLFLCKPLLVSGSLSSTLRPYLTLNLCATFIIAYGAPLTWPQVRVHIQWQCNCKLTQNSLHLNSNPKLASETIIFCDHAYTKVSRPENVVCYGDVCLLSLWSGFVISTRTLTVHVDSELNGPTCLFTLTCISTLGPATTVTWTIRDSVTVTVTEGTDTVLDDPLTA